MNEVMTQETPGKVLSCLSVSLVSMMFLLAVSYSDASFQAIQTSLPDPFSPQKVMAVLDQAAADYSQFVALNLTGPLKADLAYYSENVNWIIDNSRGEVLAMLGLEDLAKVETVSLPRSGQVAGAYTFNTLGQGNKLGFSVDLLYSLLIK